MSSSKNTRNTTVKKIGRPDKMVIINALIITLFVYVSLYVSRQEL